MFHRKTLRGILRFSKSSNIPAIHFLLGELPIEGQLHRDIFSLFYSVWANPQTKIFKIVKYLLETSSNNSRTWSMNVRFLSQKYGFSDPLETLESDLKTKTTYKENVITKITAFYEKELREMAAKNSRMRFLNVSLSGLRGRGHPALNNLNTTYDVEKSRHHLKMLSGDYYTFEAKALHSGGSSHCRACSTNSTEDIIHLVAICEAYIESRERVKKQYRTICKEHINNFDFEGIASNNETFCQFVLDPSSMNLYNRIPINHSYLDELFKLSRDLCYAIHSTRMKIINNRSENTPTNTHIVTQ